AARREVFQAGGGDGEGAVQVDVQHPQPGVLVVGCVLVGDAGAVDQDVQAAQGPQGGTQPRPYPVAVAQVHGQCGGLGPEAAYLLGGRLQPVGVTVEQDEVRGTGFGEDEGHLTADASGGAGDDGGPARQVACCGAPAGRWRVDVVHVPAPFHAIFRPPSMCSTSPVV